MGEVRMGVTIKEIAEEAGVSIATVSHALNKTRYVSPEISDRVLAIARKKGYKAKHEVSEKNRKYKLGKMSEIALVIPNTFSVVYTRLIAVLSSWWMKRATRCPYIFLTGSRSRSGIF